MSALSPSPCLRAVNDCAMLARDEAIVDSGVTVHMILSDQIITSSRKKVKTDITTAGKSSGKENLEGGARVPLTCGADSVT